MCFVDVTIIIIVVAAVVIDDDDDNMFVVGSRNVFYFSLVYTNTIRSRHRPQWMDRKKIADFETITHIHRTTHYHPSMDSNKHWSLNLTECRWSNSKWFQWLRIFLETRNSSFCSRNLLIYHFYAFCFDSTERHWLRSKTNTKIIHKSTITH